MKYFIGAGKKGMDGRRLFTFLKFPGGINDSGCKLGKICRVLEVIIVKNFGNVFTA